MIDYKGLREEAFDANMKLFELQLVLFTFGNASAVDRHNGVFAIKPSGVLYKDLSPEKMVIVDYNGETVSGETSGFFIRDHGEYTLDPQDLKITSSVSSDSKSLNLNN